ncbi:hypothetical protein C8Q78DRAFT_962727 [Trametes maxima]|nr:hypothetical protein C8Q78DRAFT_962727 [Trametes maxima]
MPHSFVVAQFNPEESAYWLPPSGRVTAKKLVTQPFWALRFDLYPDFEHENDPHFLCAVSSRPSPQRVPNASFTLGPKRSLDPPSIWIGDFDLAVFPPVITHLQTIFDDLYLHATPAISIFGAQGQPISMPMHQVEGEGLEHYRTVARRHHETMPDIWEAQHKASLLTQHPHLFSNSKEDSFSPRSSSSFADESDQWSTFTEPVDPLYMFGQLNNPRSYCFDFMEGQILPVAGTPALIYDEIFKYLQICKDYRKPSVDAVIAWVRAARDAHHRHALVKPLCAYDTLQGPPKLLKNDPIYRIAATDLSHVKLVHHEGDPDLTTDGAVISEDDSQFSKVDPEQWHDFYVLPWSFHSMDHLYPKVPLGRPRVVALDIFGTILDRDAAIRDALGPWLTLARPHHSLEEIIKLYTELEALESRRQSDHSTYIPKIDYMRQIMIPRKQNPPPTSLATIVYQALTVLAERLHVSIASSPGLLEDALTCILRPEPYADVVSAIDTLLQQGVMVICIAPYSAVTLDFLRPLLPMRMTFCPIPVSIHTHVPESYFASLMNFSLSFAPDLKPNELLVASSSVGRVIAPASLTGHPTVHVKRSGCLEANVEFVIGTEPFNPKASLVVDSLGYLCDALCFGLRG